MACNCIPTVIPTTTSTCVNCLKVVSLRYSCDQGPSPCGDTLVVDLATYNDVTACSCGSVVYTVLDYDLESFSSVTITSAGVITITTSDEFTANAEGLITYRVDCPCSLLSATGNIYVCKKNECANVLCDEGFYCDPCDGVCKAANSDLGINNGGVIAYTGGGTGFA